MKTLRDFTLIDILFASFFAVLGWEVSEKYLRPLVFKEKNIKAENDRGGVVGDSTQSQRFYVLYENGIPKDTLLTFNATPQSSFWLGNPIHMGSRPDTLIYVKLKEPEKIKSPQWYYYWKPDTMRFSDGTIWIDTVLVQWYETPESTATIYGYEMKPGALPDTTKD